MDTNDPRERDGIQASVDGIDTAPTDKEIITDAIEGLMMAASYTEDRIPIAIKRWKKGKQYTVLQFVIHPLDEDVLKDLRKKATRPLWNEHTGKKPEMKLDNSLFEALLIYAATDPEDRKRLWDNEHAMQKMGVTTNTALINAALKPGEKSLLATKISESSGYVDDDEMVEQAKN